MWTIIIALGIGVILSIFVFDEDFISTTIISGVVGTIVAFALPAKTEVISFNFELNDNVDKCYHIYKEDGLFSSDLKCAFFYEDYNGSFRIMEQKIDDVSFRYTLTGAPRMVVSKRINSEDSFINYFAIDNEYRFCVIYVPESFKANNIW
jgi:hypothetical protein